MIKPIKIIISLMLLLCLLDMPYGYYELVRFASLVGFSILAFKAYEIKNNTLVIVYIGLALLFQPFFKIALGRDIWNIVDVIVALGLLISIFIDTDKK